MADKEEIVINLNWSQESKKKRFSASLLGGNKEIELGCYYELENGERMILMDNNKRWK